MKIILLLITTLLAACGGGGERQNEPPNNHGYGFHFDVQGASGLRLRYTPTLNASNAQASAAFYEDVFLNVMRCTGISVEMPPFVIIVPVGSLDGVTKRSGLYFSNPPLIVVESAVAFEHEAIHYLREKLNGDPDGAHTSPMFGNCSQLLMR